MSEQTSYTQARIDELKADVQTCAWSVGGLAMVLLTECYVRARNGGSVWLCWAVAALLAVSLVTGLVQQYRAVRLANVVRRALL